MKKIAIFLFTIFLVSCSGGDQGKAAKTEPAEKTAPVAQAAPANQSGQPTQATKKTVPHFSTIAPTEALALIKSKKNLLVLDVRSPEELKEGKIAGSTLVPFWDIAKGNYRVPSNQPVLLVCAVGGRSFAVGQYLNRQGYPEVYNLKGGMTDWKKAGLPVIY